MGSDIFNLKSLYLEDTVVRGARISTKNAPTTRSVEVNPVAEDEIPIVKTGETGVNKDYLIQSSLIGNDLNGYGTFTQNSNIIKGYTGAQNIVSGDKIKLDTDRSIYTITGIQGTDIYTVEKYSKNNITDPDIQTGPCLIEKVLLDSVKYEKSDNNIVYYKDESEWGVTGMNMSDPIIAPSNVFNLDTGLNVQFQKGTLRTKPDLSTVLSSSKTLVNNNTSPVSDVSLSPIPYPHSSLQIMMGPNGEELKVGVEGVDYVINYTDSPEIMYPIPPYEEREVAYIKFLGSMTDEVQVNPINSSFDGNMVINEKVQESGITVTRPVQDIISTDDFSIKVAGLEKGVNSEYVANYEAGIVTFVEHTNRESLIDTLTYPKKIVWDGISVIKGVREDEVEDPNNLVVPGVSGINDIDYTIYFEDTDTNNLIRDVDFIIDPESGAFNLTSPMKEDEAVLVSYYVEGIDIKDEKVDLGQMRLKSFPLITDSLYLTKKYNVLSDTGVPTTKTRLLIEGIDFMVSYVTGYIQLFPSNEITVDVKASYTPMSQINCVAQSIANSTDYVYTILEDVLEFTQNESGSKRLIFIVNNPTVSVPKKILFDSDKVDGNYNFSGSILPENILEIKAKDTDRIFNVQNAKYDDLKKMITLDSSLNGDTPRDGDIVVGTYSIQSDVLPYAPVLLLYTVINEGDSSFLIEGYDKTDILRAGIILRMDNKDPESTNYFMLKDVTYQNQSTQVDIYGTFPETAVDPLFSVFDASITWESLSSDVVIDTSSPISSDHITFNGGSLFVSTNLKIDALLLISNQEIYTITSITVNGNSTDIGIYPNLRSTLTSNIVFSRSPVYEEGITTLPADKFILQDPVQPAFSLWYQAPEGFEGNAKVLFLEDKIFIEEFVSGISNPVKYEFLTTDYQDIYALAKAIQATPSTFKNNVPYLGVPDYLPFTIEHSGEEEYYLGAGVWSPSALVPFEEETYINLPYTFTIITELYKYTLLELFKGKNEFTVKDVDVSSFYTPGKIVSFINQISERYFFSKVIGSEYVSDNTVVSLSSSIIENMVSPFQSIALTQNWEDLTNTLLSIDYENSKFIFSGYLIQDIRIGTLLIIGESEIYQVLNVSSYAGGFDLIMNPVIEYTVAVQSYTGYIKFCNVDDFISVGNINEKKLEIDTDYSLDDGVIELVTPVESLDRYLISYMGLDNLYENEGDSITCSCRYLSSLPIGYRLDVYFEYQNIDQFYIQKLTERNFSEIVVVPQIEEIIEQKGSGGGQGNDSGATNDAVPTYEGGTFNLDYLLRDEYIKKQLYLRFYKWYKERLRGLSGELQLGLGFKTAHSNAIGEVDGYYSLEDQYVETEDYTLTKDEDIDQIQNGFSKFYPVGYEGAAPDYYHRFKKEYLTFNEVYCCNIKYKNDKNTIVTVGIVKSDRPYWNKTSDLIFKVWEEDYIDKNLIGYYSVDVPSDDRSFSPDNYSFLKVVEVGDKIKQEKFKKYYTISEIISPDDKDYEYMITNKFTDTGVKLYDITSGLINGEDAPFDTLIENLPSDGDRIWIYRQEKESFPMCDDRGNLGATSYGESIEGLIEDSRKIKKPFFGSFLKLFFPNAQSAKNFKIWVKKDSEGSWESIGEIDLSKLSFKEERNIDDVMDALRNNFITKFIVPSIPPYTVYDISDGTTNELPKGFADYFYLTLEKMYDANSSLGYYHVISLKAKDRNWWFKVSNDGSINDDGVVTETGKPIVGDYGYSSEKVYENFYDPDNIYKNLLLEKQAWQTEELIIRDLYDYSDKIARAFDQGNLNRVNSIYQNYLAMPDNGTVLGISDILRQRIPSYEKQLRFLVDTNGPVYRILYPDLVHSEDSATPDIALTYNQTLFAWNLYNAFYSKYLFYYNLNEDNNNTWKKEYIRWVMSLERGIIYQKNAKQMYNINTGVLTIGLKEEPTIKISLSSQSTYVVSNPKVTLSSTYDGKYIQILFNLESNGVTIPSVTCLVYLYDKQNLNGIPIIVYKTIDQVSSEISQYTYEGVSIFSAENIFEHYENDIVSRFCYVTDQLINPVNGITLNTTNVADHRTSDPRILFLNKKVEDRVYTHEIRELPGFNLSYFGGYYLLKYSSVGMTITLNNYLIGDNFKDLNYGVFYDDAGQKTLILRYTQYYTDSSEDEIITKSYKLYNKVGDTYEYKTLAALALELDTNVYSASVPYANRSLLCDAFNLTSDYVEEGGDRVSPYIITNSIYNDLDKELNQCYYRVYRDDLGVKKFDVLFYNLIDEGNKVVKDTTISDQFVFSLQKDDLSFKTLSEISSEISNFKYHGEKILGASSVYEPIPNGDLSTTFVIKDNTILPIGLDWLSTIYVDTYIEAISGNEANSRTVASIKNAVFCFPMYTANGNINKTAIEDIPVAGNWEIIDGEEVIEVGCLDGETWSVSFSDYDSGDFKSYMAPQEIITLIDSGSPITEEQYNQIKITEDKPSVAVLKELILTRNGGSEDNEIRFNLRKYNTVNELAQAITLSRFNDDGDPDVNGNRVFFTASVIGDPEIQGLYKSPELYSAYTPIIKSFTVTMDDGTTEYKNLQLIGWELTRINMKVIQKYNIKMSSKRYSYGSSYKFNMASPETAYIDTLYNNPQGFRRDILAFDIYSWDYNAHYEIRNNWIYFKSDSIDYFDAADLGQPNKTLGYGIPLAGSGHSMAPDNENLLSLMDRINKNTVVNKLFYASLKFTRDDKFNPGYFEYNYLPNLYADVPRSIVDNIYLNDDDVMSISPGTGYVFTDSDIAIDSIARTMDLSCDWKFDYTYERTFFFSETANSTISGLVNSIDNALAPSILLSLADSEVLSGLGSTLSRNLLPTYIPKVLKTTGTSVNVNVGYVKTPALGLSLRTATGPAVPIPGYPNFIVNEATFNIPKTRDRLVINCKLTYSGTYSLTGYDLSTQYIETLSTFINSIHPLSNPTFTPLFNSSSLSVSYGNYSAIRLLSTTKTIDVGNTLLKADLKDVVAFKVLNMALEGTVQVANNSIHAITFNTYNTLLPDNRDMHAFVDSITGDYSSGFLFCDILPIKIESVDVGILRSGIYNLTSNNTPAHVYFGILGDIKFVQISDNNLHVQYNYIKERLGMPWKDAQGNLEYDYYTSENYNENNPTAIDLDNFLGYLRTGRYNQIKSSIINEGVIDNKYLWLYMKFHKEFGCDQRAKMLEDAIKKGDQDIETLKFAL